MNNTKFKDNQIAVLENIKHCTVAPVECFGTMAEPLSVIFGLVNKPVIDIFKAFVLGEIEVLSMRS